MTAFSSPAPVPSVPRTRFGRWVQYHAPGIRCEALILMGFVWMLLGWGVLNGIPEPRGGLLFELVPLHLRAVVWISTGAFAMFAGFRSRGTEIALGLLNIMPLLRLVSYMLAWADSRHILDMPGAEFAGGWYYAGIYLVQVGFILFAARIPPGLLRGKNIPRGGGNS